MNLYKVVFLGAVQEQAYINVVGHPMTRTPDGPPKTVHYLCSTYHWAESSADLIERVKLTADLEGMRVEDFTKISLVCSDKAIGTIMKERS